MDMQKLLLDATGALPGSSRRSQCVKVVDIIAKHPGDQPAPPLTTVAGWFRRSKMPSDRLLQLVRAVKADGRELDVLNY